MYAIARIAGKQFRIAADETIKVPKLPLEEGATYEITDILFATDGEKSKVGADAKGIKALAKVVSHGRDDKIMVHRKKRRKGFEVTKGHRQGFTLLRIEKIEGLGEAAAPQATAKVEAKPKVKHKAEAETKSKVRTKSKAAKLEAEKGE